MNERINLQNSVYCNLILIGNANNTLYESRSAVKMEETEACKRINEILEGLPKWHEPSNNLPKNGIYFFYE